MVDTVIRWLVIRWGKVGVGLLVPGWCQSIHMNETGRYVGELVFGPKRCWPFVLVHVVNLTLRLVSGFGP